MEAVGIDFGASFTRIACHTGDPKATIIDLIENKNGHFDIPSIIAFDKNRIVAGDEAEILAKIHPETAVHNIKCFLSKNIIWDKKHLKNENVTIENDQLRYKENTYKFIRILEEIFKLHFQTYLFKKGIKPNSVTIALPVYFDKYERNNFEIAAKNAGFTGVKTVNYPTAAIAAYQKEFNTNDGRYLVVNCSALLTEATYVIVKGSSYQTVATAILKGKSGNSLNHQLSKMLLSDLNNDDDQDVILNDQRSMSILQTTVEEQKHSISKTNNKLIKFITPTLMNGVTIQKDITVNSFETLADELSDNIQQPINDLFESLNISGDDVDYVVLTGGTTNIPLYREKIFNACEKDIEEAKIFSQPSRAIAVGAAILDEMMLKRLIYTDSSVGLKQIFSCVNKDNDPPNKNVGIQLDTTTYFTLIEEDTKPGDKKAYTLRTCNRDGDIALFKICTKPFNESEWKERYSITLHNLPDTEYYDLNVTAEFKSNKSVTVTIGIRGSGKYVKRKFSL